MIYYICTGNFPFEQIYFKNNENRSAASIDVYALCIFKNKICTGISFKFGGGFRQLFRKMGNREAAFKHELNV